VTELRLRLRLIDVVNTANNGYNPLWNETFEFTLHLKDQAVLLLMVYDADWVPKVSARTKLAYYCLPVRCLRQGYRILHLRDPSTVGGKEIPMCTLLCKFELDEVTSTRR